MTSRTASQSGSAFFLILIGIFLFAGLSYAVMQSSRTSQATMTAEQARVAAEEITSFANTVTTAVQTLKLRGCTDTQINFYTNIPGLSYGTTNNPLAPADKSCNVFDMNGGKVNMSAASPAWKDPASASSMTWMANFSNAVTNIGTTQSELAFFLVTIKKEICVEINKQADVSNPSNSPPANPINDPSAAFVGAYSATYTINKAGLNGHPEFCLNESGQYKYYRVLIAR